MGSRDEAPSVALSKLEAAARHNRVLLHALQTCPRLCTTIARASSTRSRTAFPEGVWTPPCIWPEALNHWRLRRYRCRRKLLKTMRRAALEKMMNQTENSTIDQDTVAIPLVELAGLAKAADKLRNVPLPPLPKEQGTIAGLRYWDMYSLQQHARTAIALHARQAKPFMYAIQGPDGEAHIDENCVAGDPAALAIEVNGLNDSPDAGYSIVPVYLGAGVAQPPNASNPRQPMIGRLLDELAALPVLWGLGEPGALVRQGQVFDMMVSVGKEYACATQSVEQPAPVAGREPAPRTALAMVLEWEEFQRISDIPAIREALQDFSDDPTGDNGVYIVREVLKAAQVRELSDAQIIEIAVTTRSAEANKDGGYMLPISFARAIIAAAKKRRWGMSRRGYSDDFDDYDPLALGRYRAQVMSAVRGRRGQALLTELLAALDAMPDMRLVAGELEADGQFCALGVVGQARGLNLATIDTYDVEALGPKFNIAEQLAREIMWVNDEHVSNTRWVEIEVCGPLQRWQDRFASVRLQNENAGTERWSVVRNWVASHIAPAAAAQTKGGTS